MVICVREMYLSLVEAKEAMMCGVVMCVAVVNFSLALGRYWKNALPRINASRIINQWNITLDFNKCISQFCHNFSTTGTAIYLWFFFLE
jgi:hypothetical protein